MSVMTVCGPTPAEALGVVTTHEHVFIDIRNQFSEFTAATRRAISEQPVQMSNLDALSRNPYAVKDNLTLNDAAVAEDEVMRFKRAGGDTIVDATSVGIGRDPEALLSIARATGLNIVAGCGYYTGDTHPTDMDSRTVEQIKQEMLTDIQQGIDGTRIRAGVIGEIGTSVEILPNERKALAAAAEVQAETGLGMHVHTYPWGAQGLAALEIARQHGARLDKVVIDHVDVEIDLNYCVELIKTGAFIEFDNLGKEYFIDRRFRGFAGGVFARDIERVRAIKQLIEAGYVRHLLLSNDLCLKTMLHRYGGWGYDHLLTNIVPMLIDEGITPDHIDVLLRENPRRFLDVPG
jgi:phosphotriesterase-related protein